ncbi:MAG: hypothetical protein [Circular genetic element sp.]|nr:MAG: hypothetical protein [Circular genetic element sp.]
MSHCNVVKKVHIGRIRQNNSSHVGKHTGSSYHHEIELFAALVRIVGPDFKGIMRAKASFGCHNSRGVVRILACTGTPVRKSMRSPLAQTPYYPTE